MILQKGTRMKKKFYYIGLSILRSTVKFLCFLAVFSTVNTLFMRFTEQFGEENREGWSLAIMIFVMLSVSWVFYHFNKRAQMYFMEFSNSLGNSRKSHTFARVLRSMDFYNDAGVCCILSSVSPFIFPYTDIERLFFENTNLNAVIQKLLIGIFIGFLFCIIQWFTIFDVRKKWLRNKEISSKNETLRIVAYLFFITVMYTVGFYIAMAYVPGLSVYAFLLKELFWEILTVIGIIFLCLNGKRIRKRKKFIAGLKRISTKSGYELSKIKKPYLSVFRKMQGASFTIEAHQKTYQCKLISGKRKGIPIIFSDEGFLLFRRIIRIGKTKLFSIYSKYDYSFESDVKKCLIITCVPAICCFKDSCGHMHRIESGEKIGEYTVYTPDGFLGCLDRDCLDR